MSEYQQPSKAAASLDDYRRPSKAGSLGGDSEHTGGRRAGRGRGGLGGDKLLGLGGGSEHTGRIRIKRANRNRTRGDGSTMRRSGSFEELMASPAIVNNMTRNANFDDLLRNNGADVDVDDAMTSNMPRVSSLKDLVSPGVLLELVVTSGNGSTEETKEDTNKLSPSVALYPHRADSKKDLMDALDGVEGLLCPLE